MRRAVLAAGVVAAVVVVVALVVRDDVDEAVEPVPVGTTTTTVGDAPECLPVGSHVRGVLRVGAAAAVAAEQDGVWYVSESTGATWATTLDPQATGGAGVVVALNDAARASPIDLPPGQLDGVDGQSLAAAASRGCATGG